MIKRIISVGITFVLGAVAYAQKVSVNVIVKNEKNEAHRVMLLHSL